MCEAFSISAMLFVIIQGLPVKLSRGPGLLFRCLELWSRIHGQLHTVSWGLPHFWWKPETA